MIQFSLYKIVRVLTPQRHRKPVFVAWLKVFVSYLEKILHELYQLWQDTRTEAAMTPQIIYIEHLLNTRYGRDPWDILIDDGYYTGPWIFKIDEPSVPAFYMDQNNSFVWSDADSTTVDFVVRVPEALEMEVPVIAATVSKYKLPGKYFVIQLY